MADAVEEGKALRKDEEIEAEAAESRLAESASDSLKRPAHAIDVEEELKDDELLGESTLAKLAPIPSIEEIATEEVVVDETVPEESVIDENAGIEGKE
jgi:hypothetical protein